MKNLGFIVWNDEPTVYPPGETAIFSDGITVSLYDAVKQYLAEINLDIGAVNQTIELIKNGNPVAKHDFVMNKIETIWLIADPAATDQNPSFSPAFLSVFAQEPAGKHQYEVRLYLNDDLYQQGNIIYESNGINTGMNELLTKFDHVDTVRQQANLKHQKEYAEQLAKEEAAQKTAREFEIKIKNLDPGHTKYVICTNQNVMSEEIYEVRPGQTLTLNLFRGTYFELKYFDQNWQKNDAIFIDMVNQSLDGTEFTIN